MGLMAAPIHGSSLVLTPNPITCDGQQHLVVALEPRETLGALLRRTVPDWGRMPGRSGSTASWCRTRCWTGYGPSRAC